MPGRRAGFSGAPTHNELLHSLNGNRQVNPLDNRLSTAETQETILKRRTVVASLAVLNLVAGAGGLLPTSAIAQGAYPSRAITMIVPFPPGGMADLVARPVAEAMSRELGQPVVIENKAGAGGGIGMGLAAKARADGLVVINRAARGRRGVGPPRHVCPQ